MRKQEIVNGNKSEINANICHTYFTVARSKRLKIARTTKERCFLMSDSFKVLIGYDGSSFADSAIDDLKKAGLPDKVETVILTVAEVWLPPHEENEIMFPTEEIKQKFEKKLQILREAEKTAHRAEERIKKCFPTGK